MKTKVAGVCFVILALTCLAPFWLWLVGLGPEPGAAKGFVAYCLVILFGGAGGALFALGETK